MLIYTCITSQLAEYVQLQLRGMAVVKNYEEPEAFKDAFAILVEEGMLPDGVITGARRFGAHWAERSHAPELVALGVLNKIPEVVIYTSTPGQFRELAHGVTSAGGATRVTVIPKNEPSEALIRIRELLTQSR